MTKNAWLEFAGDTPVNRLLDVLLTGREFDYTLTDLANKAGISWSTLHRIFPRMERSHIVAQTRTIGRAKLYVLRTENPVVKQLIALYDTILLQVLDAAQKQEEMLVEV